MIGTGGFLVLAASFSALAPAALMIGCVGACAGTTYVTGFTVLQESVPDELRGRTFATLYTVVRLCLLISLTISPLWADFWDWVTQAILGSDQSVSIGPYSYALPGVRIALWGGGIITFVAGFFAWHSIRKAERLAAAAGEPTVPEEGPLEFVALGLIEPSPVAEPEHRSRGGRRHGRRHRHRRQRGRRGRARRRSRNMTQPITRGRFVVLEGGDGSGKSTQARLLAAWLRGQASAWSRRSSRARARSARCCASVLLHGPAPVTPVAEALLMAADRAQHVATEIEPALARGDWVVCDRYVPSSLVYQGVVRGLGVDVVEQLSAVATGGLAPDVVVLLDVSDAVADLRRNHESRADESDRLEREGSAFHASVRAAYRELAPERRWIVVDADGSVDTVAALVRDAVAPLLAG